MNNVIGPVDPDHWYYLRQLKESYKHAEDTNPDKYRLMINTHKDLYRQGIKEIIEQ